MPRDNRPASSPADGATRSSTSVRNRRGRDPNLFVAAAATPAGNASHDAMNVYIRDLATVDVMSREEELRAAERIAELRTSLWRAILGYPPYVDAICTLAAEVLSAEACPAAELEVLRRAARALRDRDLVAHQQAFEASRKRLAQRLGLADPDHALCDRILADLTSLEMGDSDRLHLRVKLPPRGSARFTGYVAAVRENHYALAAAKNAFVAANLRLVVTIARRFKTAAMSLQDRIQEGNLGLMRAVDRFDYRRGVRFSTYAGWWIRHMISRAIADKGRNVRLPVHMISSFQRVDRARREFEALHGRAPTDEEIIERTGVNRERLRRMHWALAEAISLDQPISGDGQITGVDCLEDRASPAAPELMDSALRLQRLRELLPQLSPIELDILGKRMGFDEQPEQTLAEIGVQYSVSRERIRQLQEQALEKLRAAFRRDDLL